MYKLEYKEKISAETDKLSAALQKVGFAAYSEAKEEPSADGAASGDSPSGMKTKKKKEKLRKRANQLSFF